MNFKLTEKETEACDKFLEKLPKKYKYLPVQLLFKNDSGIGTSIIIIVGDKSKDITDYDSW